MNGISRPHIVLRATDLRKSFAPNRLVCRHTSLEVAAGEIVVILGESGSGKSTLLRCLGGQLEPDAGVVEIQNESGVLQAIWALQEEERVRLLRSDVGFFQQRPQDGLRMNVTAGANIAESLALLGLREFTTMRQSANDWLESVEIDADRIDDLPGSFSGGMQQRLQLARSLVKRPKLLLMDEPTGGLDVSVQAKILDLLRKLVRNLKVAVLLVTHDLGVARMLADRIIVLKSGAIVEEGIADQILDDPHHPYTQLLVSSVLRA
ncbi:ATP-binding cassette domain-containing protein [Rhizobium sp. 1AS11]|uniref:ATP-binding cassette domain-containing protein n=1 Tax=Rhizobium acaciae TaxID=2989736 RepID=UPI00222156F9|nr:ATP-binding cassette domain-containing protein [Rhizobium acaciae]MCW1412989.1 ATP-binding cassette domain-containing protein [Rhizobium acaciae]MCW1745141.1 ATP-binding cassette domain-containing protein [Rhizobium acaciae]